MQFPVCSLVARSIGVNCRKTAQLMNIENCMYGGWRRWLAAAVAGGGGEGGGAVSVAGGSGGWRWRWRRFEARLEVEAIVAGGCGRRW